MNGTPSCAFGTVIPWKWRTVGWSSWFSTTIRMWSPYATSICGPGIWPLNAIASTNCPFETSHFTLDAVSAKTFVVPSIVGAKSWFPWVGVWLPARNASTPALCIDAIISALILVPWPAAPWPAELDPVVPAPGSPVPAVTVASMPRSLCPDTVQYAGYVPASRAGTFRTTVVSGSMRSVSYVVPATSTANVCGAWPMFITENSMGWPTGTAMAEGSIANSLSMTSTVAGPAAACSVVPLPVAPPVHDAPISAMALATPSVPHLRIDLIIVRSSCALGSDMLPRVSARAHRRA